MKLFTILLSVAFILMACTKEKTTPPGVYNPPPVTYDTLSYTIPVSNWVLDYWSYTLGDDSVYFFELPRFDSLPGLSARLLNINYDHITSLSLQYIGGPYEVRRNSYPLYYNIAGTPAGSLNNHIMLYWTSSNPDTASISNINLKIKIPHR